MATIAQIDANRQNAENSTGPRTPEGKAISSKNALREGFHAKGFIVLPGEEDNFAALKEQLRQSLKPDTGIEIPLFDKILECFWNLHRARMAEVQLMQSQDDPTIDPLLDDKNEAKWERIRKFKSHNE